jgi:adenosine deaminase
MRTSRGAAAVALLLALSPATIGVHGQEPGAAHGQEAAQSIVARYFDGIRHDPVRSAMFLREMPKGGDLHSHLSGAVYAETYIEWAADLGLCVDTVAGGFEEPPCDAAAGRPPASAALRDAALYNRVIDALSVRNWTGLERSGHEHFFSTFYLFRLTSIRSGPMLAEAATRAAANRAIYLELMVTLDANASGRMGGTLGYDPDLEVMRQRLLTAGLRDTAVARLRGLDAAEAIMRQELRCGAPDAGAGCDVTVRYLYQVGRGQPPEQVFGQILMGFEMAQLDGRVVGLNLVQPEDSYLSLRDYSLHMRMIGALRNHYPDVRVTLHAGELAPGLVPPERLRFHIGEAVRVARADRIGHGVAIAWEDGAHELLQEMARRGVLVEIALGSNDVILGVRGRHHPLRLYMDYGIPVALVTDDEAVLRSELTMQYHKAVEEHGLRYHELKQMARNAIDFSFADDATKARLRSRLDADFAAFERMWAQRAAEVR